MDVLPSYKWGLVSASTLINQNVQQGGVLVIRNGEICYQHFDEGTGEREL